MFSHRTLGAAIVGAAVILASAASAGMLDKSAVKSNEVIGPAAKGDPKPYHALVNGTCEAGLCMVNFGKKAKERRIDIVTCGVITDEEPQLAAIIFGELGDSNVRFYLPLASVAPQGAGKVGMFEFDFGFDVPANAKMQVVLQTSGTPSTAACTATGTIR